MRKNLITTITALPTAVLFTVTTANATIHNFTSQSSDAELIAAGEFMADASEQVTGISGVVSEV